MTVAWRSMISWEGGLTVIAVLLATLLYPVVAKIRRRSDRPRSGTLEVLSGGKDAEFDIIAVHGLGADPDRTWTQSVKSPQQREAIESQPTQYSGKIHLLQDLLKSDFPAARILSFKYNSNWLSDAPVKTTEEVGKRLLEEIKAKRSRPHLPIVFIGHSLGGIIIKQALCRPDSEEIINDTAGIIFLGTPHQGSPVSINAAALAYMTRLLGSDTTLVLSLMSNEVQLTNLADTFRTHIAPNESRRQKPRIISFYETKPMYLLRFLSLGLIVSRNSAVLHADEVHDIDTDHSGLNKCTGQEDELYTQLKVEIDSLRAPSLLKQADTLIRNKRYAPKELKIERLSGDLLSMDQCYINLAIVEQSGQIAGGLGKGSAASSPFSLFAREKVETPGKASQVNLATIFNQRKALDGLMIEPRRVLIRGRAGVGKTTLCKKMVYDFTYGTQTELYRSWAKLFDRVLWVPLRNLKPRHTDGYTYNDLFYHEYFSGEGETDGRRLAEELWQAVKDPHRRTTLFILDGLDEISYELGRGDDMARFLNLLFDQPNIIITSRPNARLPVNLRGLDLELETIGFYPNQVKDYIQNAFADPNTGEPNKRNANKVQSFLQSHQLVQGLVRIPIQLDALCYTWEDIHPETPLSTITDIYNSMMQRLWKKDVLKLEKQHEGKYLTAGDIDLPHVKDLVQDEICFLEGLAFTGLHNDAIDFPSEHQDAISKHFRSTALILNKMLPHLSFLRTPDPSSKNPSYHFLHLTFQEYFAAGYFVRHWRAKQDLRCLGLNRKRIELISPRKFLQKHKYSARYDVFWRLVSGLLEAEEAEELLGFFNEIEAEPRDLLGPTHQRLVMHCLSEVHTSTTFPIRLALETKLSQWLLFEIDLERVSFLAREPEFPENLLCAALKTEPDPGRRKILGAMSRSSRQLSGSAIQILVELLEECNEDFQSAITEVLSQQSSLPEEVITRLTVLLGDENYDLRIHAIRGLGYQSTLPETTVTVLTALLKEDTDTDVRFAAAQALGNQSNLPDATITVLVTRLADSDIRTRGIVANVLGRQLYLSRASVEALIALFKDTGQHTRSSGAVVLGRPSGLQEGLVTILTALLENEDSHVKSCAARVLWSQSNLPEATITALIALLEDEAELVQVHAAAALVNQSPTRSDAAIAAIAALTALLKSEGSVVRKYAAKGLRNLTSTLPEAAITPLIALLKDEEEAVREHAAAVLGNQSSTLPEAVTTPLIALLKDEGEAVRRRAFEALGRQSSTLPETAITALILLLNDEEWFVRVAAIETLGQQSSTLPETAITALILMLNDEEWFVRHAAVKALGQQSSTLPETAITALILLLNDEGGLVRQAAVNGLGQQSSILPESAIMALVARLKDEDKVFRSKLACDLGLEPILLDRLLKHAGLLFEPQGRTKANGSTLLNTELVEHLYGSMLFRSFQEHVALYNDGHSCCIVEQASELRTASFESRSLYDQFQAGVRRGRQLWNDDGYKLWDSVEGEVSDQ